MNLSDSLSRLLCLALIPLCAQGADPVPPPARLELIQEIDVTQTPPGEDQFREYPAGASSVVTVLGSKVRLMPNNTPGDKYFGYRLGKGKNLKAGDAFLVEVIYPEDTPRSMFVANWGCDTNRGFHTGRTLGDCIKPKYVNNLPESLELPLSQKFERWQSFFHLHDKVAEQKGTRDQKSEFTGPENGFWLFIGQFTPEQDPLSEGAAVARIRLYRAPAAESTVLKLNLPPKGLPQRHLFFREEMADGIVSSPNAAERGVEDPQNWYAYKFSLMKFLGMNTFAKDLLEFGANQGWDSAKYGGNQWVYQSKDPQRWTKLVARAGQEGLNVLPYFEYAGSKGAKGLGMQKRATPLNDKPTYTHIKWAESARADLTDPETFEDLRKMLEITIADEKTKANFVGAWLRPRNSQLPVSFADATLARFTQETKAPEAVTRAMLSSDHQLYDKYISWWHGKRQEFLDKVAAYLKENASPEAVLLYTTDVSEPGRPNPQKAKNGLVAEDPAAWEKVGQTATALAQAIQDRRQFEAMTKPLGTWGGWEWQHSVPSIDIARYKTNQGVVPTYTFNRAFTVADEAAFEAFETGAGLGIIRHYSLNENMFRDEANPTKKDPLGYFVADFEHAGPYCMLAEARAMANGNPRFIGYLSGNSFNRGFPEYVRNFNAAFLSLPALPSRKLDSVSSDGEVVVRAIDAGNYGTYLAVVNTGYGSKQNIALKLPGNGKVLNAATLQEVPAKNGVVSMSMYPCQLVALHISK